MRYNNVYTVHEENSHRFYQVPKEFFINEKYRIMNSDAKVLYSILLDRKELSRKNDWVDDYGQVYLIYTRENLAELLSISVRSIQKAFKLLNELNLIIEERQGLNKPNKIYICKTESHSQQGHAKSAHQDKQNVHGSDTEYSETERKNNIITSNDAFPLNYYGQIYQQYLNKEHPRIRDSQLNEVLGIIEEFNIEHDVDNEEWAKAIEEHFESLPTNNDGNCLAFFTGDYKSSPLIRKLEVK